MHPNQLTRMQVAVQAQALAILCCQLNKHPKLAIYQKNSSQPPSMVSKVNFIEILSSLSVWRPNHSNEGMLRTLSGKLIPIARPPRKHPVHSFDVWLQVWTKYEMEIVSEIVTWNWQPTKNRYSLPTNSFIGLLCTSLKYKHASTRPHARTLKLALTSWIQLCMNHPRRFRLHPKQRTHCKSFNHLMRDCTFLTQEKPQEVASSPSKPSVNGTSAIESWKLQKWFTPAGQEFCNLYQ